MSVDVGDCDMDLRLYTPDDGGQGPLVVLSHGFTREPENMEGWARHLAGWGLKVAVPSLCHATLWDTDHEANAEELLEMSRVIGQGPTIYVGHSAGGLAGLLAGLDDQTVAIVGLDLTDADDLGFDQARDTTIPIYGLVAEPSDCNDDNNGLAAFALAPDAQVLRVTEADHCDFEDVTNWVCTSLCGGSNDTFSEQTIRGTIKGLMTAAVMTSAALDTRAVTHWWQPGGPFYDALDTEGMIQQP